MRIFNILKFRKICTGDRVRTVVMNGCMAHIRGEIKEGRVVDFGDSFIRVKFEDGTTETLAPERYWVSGEDHVMEYHK